MTYAATSPCAERCWQLRVLLLHQSVGLALQSDTRVRVTTIHRGRTVIERRGLRRPACRVGRGASKIAVRSAAGIDGSPRLTKRAGSAVDVQRLRQRLEFLTGRELGDAASAAAFAAATPRSVLEQRDDLVVNHVQRLDLGLVMRGDLHEHQPIVAERDRAADLSLVERGVAEHGLLQVDARAERLGAAAAQEFGASEPRVRPRSLRELVDVGDALLESRSHISSWRSPNRSADAVLADTANRARRAPPRTAWLHPPRSPRA